MHYTTLGQTDIKISRICLGTMTWGTQNTEDEGHAQMDYALSEGVNFWDTAEMYATPPSKQTYGSTETIIGTWLKSRGKRDEVVIASKIAPQVPYIRDGAPIDKENLIKAVDDSLARLQTDYIDLYQIHWPSNRNTFHFHNSWNYTPRTTDKEEILANQIEILETVDSIIKAGKIRQFGVSNDTAWGITQYCALAEKLGVKKPVSVQNEYSLVRRRDDYDIAEVCMIEDISYLAWSPIGMGTLSGKYIGGQTAEITRMNINEEAKQRYAYRLTDNANNATVKYVELANSINIDPASLAIAFCLSRPFVTSPIIGASKLDQLKNNIAAVNITLSPETLKAIDAINKQYPDPF